jgi:hypothetical protein
MGVMMDLNYMNSKTSILIFILVDIVMLGSVFTSNNVNTGPFDMVEGIDVDSSGNVFDADFDDDRSAVTS